MKKKIISMIIIGIFLFSGFEEYTKQKNTITDPRIICKQIPVSMPMIH